VLIRARPEFSAQYGLTLHIDGIDPNYTLGDLEARKRQIRERLKAEGIFDRNRQLPAPWDYRAVLVISPPRAAGLGDFARDADRLQRHGVCEAVYAHSRFEGEGAPALIRETIESALSAWTSAALPDAIVVRRAHFFVPENCEAPVAAEIDFVTDSGAPVMAAFDFRQTGPQSWDIDIETDGATARLAEGGARFFVDGNPVTVPESDGEYPALYRNFAKLIAAGLSDVDARPFRLVADAFLIAHHTRVERFD